MVHFAKKFKLLVIFFIIYFLHFLLIGENRLFCDSCITSGKVSLCTAPVSFMVQDPKCYEKNNNKIVKSRSDINSETKSKLQMGFEPMTLLI